MDSWQRLEQIIRWTGLSTNAFAREIGLKRAENLYQIKRGNNGISRELARLISKRYPMISDSWLLTSHGEMISVNYMPGALFERATDRGMSIPFYNADIQQVVRGVHKLHPQCHISLPMLVAGASMAASYSSQAMSPDVPAGSIVVIHEVPDSAIIPGECYMIVTRNVSLLRIVRRVVTNPDMWMLCARNRTEFDDVFIEKSAVEKAYILKSVIMVKNV